jgi:hypothetical protein
MRTLCRKSLSGWGPSVLAAFAIFFFLSAQAEAKVRGVCSNCHTMHNSQSGVSMILETIGLGGGADTELDCSGCHAEPRENLLRLDCISCHARNVAGNHVWVLGGYDVPQVYHQEALGTGNSMAAGNFYYVSLDPAYGHNVHGFAPLILEEFVMPSPNIAPGYVALLDPGTPNFEDWPSASSPVPDQILCAGAYGCHGNRQVESQTQAMQGSHHADDEQYLLLGTKPAGIPAQQGSTSGLSYRYLSGVKGGEDADWEWGATTKKHNEYYGKELTTDPRPAAPPTGVETMSEFCASCHGNFHQYDTGTPGAGLGTNAIAGPPLTAGAMSPWIRHPTDILLPADGEFSAYVSYNLTVPIARTNIPATAQEDARPGGGYEPIVFCLSCHRAHAGEYWDSLRFSYAQMLTGTAGAGAGTGCFACHSDKDGI